MPIDKEKISNSAQKYLQKGQFDKAIKEFQKIVDSDPTDMRVWKKIGDIQVRSGDTRGAITTYLRLSDDFFAQGFYSKALAILRQIQTLDANIEEVYLKLAEVYAATNFLPDAIHQLDRLSKLQEAAGNIEAMLATLQRMADFDPSSWTYRAHLAETLSRLGRKSEAAAELRKVTVLLEHEHDPTDFIRVAERLMFHDPDDVDNSKKLAEAYLRSRAPEEKLKQVLKLLLRFLQNNPSDPSLLQLLARMFLALSKQDSAVNVYRELARIYREQGKITESEAVLERILEILPQDEETLIALGRKKAAPAPSSSPVPSTDGRKGTSARRGGRDFSEPIEEISLEELEEIDDIAEIEEDDRAQIVTGEDVKKLEEATAFFKFSLYDQSLELIQQIGARQALSVLELEKDVYMRLGKKEEALAIMEMLASEWEKSDPLKAQEVAQEIRLVSPDSKLADRILSSRPKVSAASADEDLFNILKEIESIESDMPSEELVEQPLTFSEQAESIHSDEELEQAMLQRDASKGIYEIDDDDDLDLAAMLDSLKGLDQGDEDVIDEDAGDDPYGSEMTSQVSDPAPFSDRQFQSKLNELDELEAFKEASQSFIRIQELSHEEIRLADLTGSAGAAPVPAQSSDEEAENPFEMTPPPVDQDYFSLGSDDPTAVRNEDIRNAASRRMSDGPQFEPTMDHVMELLSLEDQIANVFADDPEPSAPVEPPAMEGGAEEELPEEVTEVFAEVDFFLETELYDDALEMLEELAGRFPLPAVKAKIRLVRKASGAEPDEEPTPVAAEPVSEPSLAPEPISVVAPEPASVVALEPGPTFDQPFADDVPAGFNPFDSLPFSDGDDGISLDFDEEVVTNLSGLNINDLKDEHPAVTAAAEPGQSVRLETQVPAGDALTHFELGVAYKEMGLYDQARDEFKLAMEEPKLEIKAHMMVARCMMEVGKFSEAASEYKKSLHCQDISKDEEMDLYFELGQLYENLKDRPEALYFYRKVLLWDPSYRNVAQIVERLK
ncbi:tetratricopeptide repeat protein [Myxococcota bacterium]|nr:tetratricopeptide repeat protein [Myxococcota bacterium]